MSLIIGPVNDVTAYALRPYQVEAVKSVFDAFQRGIHRQLIVMATGLGKTVIVAGVAAKSGWGRGRRMFGVMHREELILQGFEKLGRQNPGRLIDYEKADHSASDAADIVLASVQTVGRSGSARLTRFAPDDFSKIWIDEVHHAPAKSYQSVLKHFGVHDNPASPKLLMGTTATPERLDKLGYDHLFDDVVFRYGLREGIENGYLAELLCFRVETRVDLTEVRVRAGDFAEEDLARAVDVDRRNRLCVDTWRSHSKGRRNLVFCVNKAHAHHVADLFRESGARTAVVVDDTPPPERLEAYEGLRAGSLDVVVNVTVFTEGIDLPHISSIHLLRPTRSTALLLQMIGRGTRREGTKQECQVFDYADTFDDKKLATLGKIFGLPAGWNCRGGSILEQVRQVEELQETFGTLPLEDSKDFAGLKSRLVRLDPLRMYSSLPAELEDLTTFKWWRRRPDCFCLSWRNPIQPELQQLKNTTGRALTEKTLREKGIFGTDEILLVEKNPLGKWETRRLFGPRNRPQREERLERSDHLSAAVRFADEWVERERPHAVVLLDVEAKWNKGPATPAQIDALIRKGYPKALVQGGKSGNPLSKGQASILIAKPVPKALKALQAPLPRPP